MDVLKLIAVVAALLNATDGPPDSADEAIGAHFLEPKPAVITQNLVKIAIPNVIVADTISRAHFFARYTRTITNKMVRSRVDTIIDIDSIPPFEVLWDCSNVPDQDNVNLWFYCVYRNTRGEWKGGNSFRMQAALDRNPAFSQKRFYSRYCRKPVSVDGDLSEWFHKDSAVFANNGNTIVADSRWDGQNLYFGVRVRDAKLYPKNNAEDDSLRLPFYLQDAIEFFFDLGHGRRSVRDSMVYQIGVRPNGRYNIYGGRWQEANWRPAIAGRRTAWGFDIEAAFPWKQFRLAPATGLTMGFNLVNTDRDDKDGVIVTHSWSGITDLQHHNPSEWGDLVLVGSGAPGFWIPIIVILAVFAGTGILLLHRKYKPQETEKEVTKQRMLVDSVKAYLEKNLGDENLDLNQAAARVNISGEHLRKLFKKETGQNFTHYLNLQRIHKGRQLLASTNKRVGEIAFEIGYSSLEHFNRIFKKVERMTPSDYRKQHHQE